MANAGEVNQAVGQSYVHVFIAALQASIPSFENKFLVYNDPDKTSFASRSGKSYSFDFCGVYDDFWNRQEVFGECKGYTKAGNLLAEFRSFLAKAYVTSTDHMRHKGDHFWFVTNVPFACSEGSGVWSFEFVRSTLTDNSNAEVQDILGRGHVDDDLIRTLVPRLGVFIFTDSFLANAELVYRVQPHETLWGILKKLHAGRIPPRYNAITNEIASKNGLRSPDHIQSGDKIKLGWHGIKSD